MGSPVDGVVAEVISEALEGMFVKPGMNLYKIADLSTVWVHADIYELEPVPDQATLEQLVEQHPSLVRFATRQRLYEARIRLAEAARDPDLDLRGGIRHLNGPDDLGLLLSVRVPLGSSDRARPFMDEVEALSAREPLLARDKRLALRATLFGLSQELTHDRAGRSVATVENNLDAPVPVES